ncbi:MAG: hypothetical protein WBP64_10990 [Nitrososphaeraceae archaeon]
MQETRTADSNKKIRKKFRTIVLSPNVNDYDTGEDITLNKWRGVRANDDDIDDIFI